MSKGLLFSDKGNSMAQRHRRKKILMYSDNSRQITGHDVFRVCTWLYKRRGWGGKEWQEQAL